VHEPLGVGAAVVYADLLALDSMWVALAQDLHFNENLKINHWYLFILTHQKNRVQFHYSGKDLGMLYIQSPTRP
jgi:hypothetical protein